MGAAQAELAVRDTFLHLVPARTRGRLAAAPVTPAAGGSLLPIMLVLSSVLARLSHRVAAGLGAAGTIAVALGLLAGSDDLTLSMMDQARHGRRDHVLHFRAVCRSRHRVAAPAVRAYSGLDSWH